MWAVFHYYAQDSAGTRRASNAAAPLIPSLGDDRRRQWARRIQTVAIALDAEADAYAGEWAISVRWGPTGRSTSRSMAGAQPVAGAAITLLMSGQDARQPCSRTGWTGALDDAGGAGSNDGRRVDAGSRAAAVVYRGSPAGPDPHGAQRLVTGGPPRSISATATVDVPVPPTTDHDDRADDDDHDDNDHDATTTTDPVDDDHDHRRPPPAVRRLPRPHCRATTTSADTHDSADDSPRSLHRGPTGQRPTPAAVPTVAAAPTTTRGGAAAHREGRRR